MKRAVIYCRVSTDEEAQLNALSGQIQEAKASIVSHNWLLVDEYVDEAKSGTTTKKRDEYKRLFEDLETDAFDIVVVKSQDRLMRNTKEWYIFVDRLAQSGKQLFFYLDNAFYTSDDSLITGIRAILAEEFSRELSKKINNAHRNRQEKGTSIIITSNTWGYDKVGKDIFINKEEAKAVELMFDLCIQGLGTRSISKELQNLGYCSRSGANLRASTIRRIIRNPLYAGNVIMNRTHFDFNTKRTIKNPKSEWIYHRGAVPAIVTEEVWEKANAVMDSRATNEVYGDIGNRVGTNTGSYPLSGKMACGMCGASYWRRHRKNSKGEKIVDWSCSEYVTRGRKTNDSNRGTKKVVKSSGGCDNIHIKESNFLDALYEIAKDIYGDGVEKIVQKSLGVLESVLAQSNKEKLPELKRKSESIMKKRESLLDRLLDGVIAEELFTRKDTMLKAEYDLVEQEISEIESKKELELQKIKRIENLKEDIINIADKELCTQRVAERIVQVTIYPDHADVAFDVLKPVRIDIVRKGYKTVIMSVCVPN